MNNKCIITLIALLLILPTISAQVKVQLGEHYTNIKDFSEIKFTAHTDYYEICSLDKTLIPVLIKNKNKFSDMFKFEVNKEYASLPVKSAVLKSGKSAILPLIISPPVGLEENTTLILDVITKKEGLKRSVKIKTDIRKCYLFELEIDKDKDELCGCDEGTYSLMLTNMGRYADTFTLTLDVPGWINSTLTNNTIKLYDGQKREIKLEAIPSCGERGVFSVGAKAISEKTNMVLEDELEITVLPQKECYNTIISADNVDMDYFGKNVPITIKNKGVKDVDYSLEVEGVDWYTLSQTDFSLKKDKEKTINLALYPNENVVEGEYSIDITAKAGDQEFTKSIVVKLKKKAAFFEKTRFYANYFRYYIGAGVVLLVIILLLMVLVKRWAKEKKVKPEEKVEKEVKKVEKKVEEKRVVKKLKKLGKKVRWLLFFTLYLIFLGLLALLVYSTFRYGPYYEKALNFILGLFTDYVVPYGSHLRYLVLGVGIVGIIILIIDFFRKSPKKERVEKKKEQKIEKEKPKEEKEEVRKISAKVEKKRKLNLFEYIYLVLVILLFLAIIGYVVYRFLGKSIPFDKFVFVKELIKGYYLYFVIGVVVLGLLIVVINFVKKFKKKPKRIKEEKVAKKVSKKVKKLIRNIVIILVGLIVLSGIVYSFVYFNLISYIKDFFIVYYPYILMGIGILTILILILHFHSKKIS